MTNEKLKFVFRRYLDRLDAADLGALPTSPRQLDADEQRWTSHQIEHAIEIRHLKYLRIESQKLVDAGCLLQVMQRLGVLQGYLWARGYYTWAELRSHMGPDARESS